MTFTKKSFFQDAVAGLTVATILIPQSIAYALLAGLPPVYGLYAALIPTLFYHVFGRISFLSVGPTALMSILVFSGMTNLADQGTAEFISLVLSVSLLSGIIQVLFGALHLGYIIRFISKPVLSGFTSAAALIILISQLKHVLGLGLEPTSGAIGSLVGLTKHLPQASLIVIGFSALGATWLLIGKKIGKYFPAALLLVVVSIVLSMKVPSFVTHFNTIGAIDAGLPHFIIPDFSLGTLQLILPLSIAVAVISFIESYAISKGLSDVDNPLKIQPNREFIALGFAKIIGSFFQAYPTTGGFSRSAVNKFSGAKSGIASVFSVSIVFLTILYLIDYLAFIPKSVLSIIIIVAVVKLIDIKAPVRLFKQHRPDFVSLIITFLATLFLGVQFGLVIGIAFSLVLLIFYNSKPNFSVLSRQDTGEFRDVTRYVQVNRKDQNLLIFRFDQDLVFWNVEHFEQCYSNAIKDNPKLKYVLLDAKAIASMDSSGAEVFSGFIDACNKKNIELFVSGLKGKIRDEFERYKIYELMKKEQYMFYEIEDAYKRVQARGGKE